MAVIELRPWSRRRHLHRLLPAVVAIVLLLIVLSAFVFIPSAEGAGAEAITTAAATKASGHLMPSVGEHLCPEA